VKAATLPALVVSVLATSLLSGCDSCRSGATEKAQPSAAASGSAMPTSSPQPTSILRAEHQRNTAAVPTELVSSRDVTQRRNVARALARIADESALDLLGKMLADEDGEVLSWAAYGLGYGCKGREIATVRALVQRAASLSAAERAVGRPPLFDPVTSLADALGRCGSQEAEATLRTWLVGPKPRAEAAALALGRLASRNKRLDDASIVALLNAGSDPDAPLDSALFAFSRLGPLPEPVENRLRDVARGALDKQGNARSFAVRSLGHAGDAALADLEKVVLRTDLNPSERADAVRELGKNASGTAGLVRVLDALAAPERLTESALMSAHWGILITALEALSVAPKEATDALARLEALPLPDAKAKHRRRVAILRCAAAAARAGNNHRYDKLQSCQPGDDAPIRDLALLKVLGRGKLQGARELAWFALTNSKQPQVRQAALQLLGAHPETRRAHAVLAAALESDQDGTVATAAQILSAYPARASTAMTSADTDDTARDVSPHADVVQALQRAFTKRRAPDATEIRQSLIAAAGALQLMRLKPEIEKECKSSAPTLRAAAEKALRLLGDRNKRCHTRTPGVAPEELSALRVGAIRISLDTDVGPLKLTLDAGVAPVTVTRIASLVEAGFYDGILFHRVVPGFVVQFGDPGADGFGGAGREALRCETSPIAFEPLSVGMALSGRDTGSSQLFVTLGPFPHLDGEYAWIGRAKGDWQRLAQGDRITKARVSP
jgi:cyclophilin family peptidyl-prolyl cis-trans isomerase